MLEIAVRALMDVNRRGVILAGWAELNLEVLDASIASDASQLRQFAAKHVHFVLENSVPHEWLFPQMAALVHHGGAGTTASALRSGVPSIITPVAFDQPELASKVEQIGVGIRLAQLHFLQAQDLSKALHLVLHDDELRARAANFGRKLRDEDGAVSTAIHLVKQLDGTTSGGPRRPSPHAVV